MKSSFKTTDVLVDNFDDSNFVNKQGGLWSLFTDDEIGGRSSTYPVSLPRVNKDSGEDGIGFKVILFRLAGNSRIMQCKNTISIPGEMFEGTYAKVEILNMRGVRVRCIPVDIRSIGKCGMVNVNLESFADGLYVVRVVSDNKRTVAIPVSVLGR